MNVPYQYNKDAKYHMGHYYSEKSVKLTELEIAVTEELSFKETPLNIFDHYLNPKITNDFTAQQWLKGGMHFFQNQVNFAVACATTGCGVSYAHHLNHTNPMLKSIYIFHTYYQVRRILSELQVPLPTDNNFHHFNNIYDKKAFQRLCNEFGIDVNTDFRQHLDLNHGMGTLYRYAVGNLYPRAYVPGFTSFNHNSQVPLLYIQQKHNNAFTTFILDKGLGFTQSGVERLNDSIRIYVWSILGSQAQTRSNIIGEGTSFDSQKQFLVNLEDSINSAVDLPASIKHYQDVLKYARSKVDVVVGIGLYMLPSDLQLRVKAIYNYNNNIVIAGSGLKLGRNPTINQLAKPTTSPAPPPPSPTAIAEKKEMDHNTSRLVLTGGLLIAGLLGLYYFK